MINRNTFLILIKTVDIYLKQYYYEFEHMLTIKNVRRKHYDKNRHHIRILRSW